MSPDETRSSVFYLKIPWGKHFTWDWGKDSRKSQEGKITGHTENLG